MLAQLMGAGLGEVAAVVVRYYGGVLLGTGGLVKHMAVVWGQHSSNLKLVSSVS